MPDAPSSPPRRPLHGLRVPRPPPRPNSRPTSASWRDDHRRHRTYTLRPAAARAPRRRL